MNRQRRNQRGISQYSALMKKKGTSLNKTSTTSPHTTPQHSIMTTSYMSQSGDTSSSNINTSGIKNSHKNHSHNINRAKPRSKSPHTRLLNHTKRRFASGYNSDASRSQRDQGKPQPGHVNAAFGGNTSPRWSPPSSNDYDTSYSQRSSSAPPTDNDVRQQQERINKLNQHNESFQSHYGVNNGQHVGSMPLNPSSEHINDPQMYRRELDPPDIRRHFNRLANQLEEHELQYGPGKSHKYTIGDDMLHKHKDLDNFQQKVLQRQQMERDNYGKTGLQNDDENHQNVQNNNNKSNTNKKKLNDNLNDDNDPTKPRQAKRNPALDNYTTHTQSVIPNNKYLDQVDKNGLYNKMSPFHVGTNNIHNPLNQQWNHDPAFKGRITNDAGSNTSQKWDPNVNSIDNGKNKNQKPTKPTLFQRLKRISPIIEQAPQQLRHLLRIAKQIKSEESLLLFQAEFKQSRKVLFSDHNIKRTKLELQERLKFVDEYLDRKMRQPYIEPTTEYRLQQKEVLHDKIIDMHYAQDRFIDKIRSKMHIFSETVSAINTDPRKREILARKIFFTSLDNDSTLARIAKILYFPFGLVLRSVASACSAALFSIELLTSKLVPEIALLSRTMRRSLADYSLTPNNVIQLMGMVALATFIATIGHDVFAMMMSGLTTPRGPYVDVAHTYLFVNSEEMVYDAVREMIANRLLITPRTYQDMYSPHRDGYLRFNRLRNPESLEKIAPPTDWGTPERTSKQLSLIQPIFTQMKQDLIGIYKDRFYLPLERLTEGLRTHQVSMGFTVEALDGFLDAMYMRDTRTSGDITDDYNVQNKIINYLLAQDFLVLPPGDVIRTQAPGEIYHHVISNFRSLEGKDPTLGGELFKDYIKLGSRVAYRKKLLHEIEMLTEIRTLLENARFPHITIPQRDIKKIACDLNDPVTRAVMSHIEELRMADSTTPLYPNRVARQLLESSYQIDSRHTHYSRDETIVNDHYLTLCNMDNPRYKYDVLCNHHNLQFKNNEQRDTFERHLYHLGMVLNKLDAILVQNYIELRNIEHHVINPLNPLEGNITGIVAKQSDLEKLNLKLPHLDDVINKGHTLPVPPHENVEHSVIFEQQSRHVDKIEYDRFHYENMILERKNELKQQLDGIQHPQALSQQQTWFNSVASWWSGKPNKPARPFSTEFDSVLQWQATRDVLNTVNNDPYLHRRYIQDYNADQLLQLQSRGYLSSDALPQHFIAQTRMVAPNKVAQGIRPPMDDQLSFAQQLFAPPAEQYVPSTIDFRHQNQSDSVSGTIVPTSPVAAVDVGRRH